MSMQSTNINAVPDSDSGCMRGGVIGSGCSSGRAGAWLWRMAWCLLFSSLFAMSAPAGAASEEIDKLVMPGALIQGHAKYEDQCDKCHRGFSKEVQTQLCADCHDDVDADIRKRTGYHGKDPAVRDQSCRSCHTDHIGREADIVIFSPHQFDHALSDFALEGAHQKVVCKGCHESGKKFRDAPGLCVDCHREDDVHNGELGEKCADCHDQKRWPETGFDHDKTDFPLREAHREVSCESCHADEKYEDTPMECVSCHRINDIHGGRYGKKCDDCHAESEWARIRFDHNRQTDYPLIGRHRRVACDSCHTSDLYADLSRACISCHRNDDVHLGRYGEKCNDCHTEKDWKKSQFDHDRDTDYKLLGKHSEVACESCHKGNATEEDLDTRCLACHGKDDIHRGAEGENCESCHNEKGWALEVSFNHDMSRFPLHGLHAVVPCEECHFDSAYRNASTACADCHLKDDDHKGQLGPDCGHCHNANSWSIWTFDHDKQTRYPLDGKHSDLACTACHDQPIKNYHDLSLPMNCIACHRGDDVHNGQFGRDCGRCHISESFRKIRGRRGRAREAAD